MRLRFVILSLLMCYPIADLMANTLTLEEVLRSTDRFYPVINMAREDIENAKGAHLKAAGQFDPLLKAHERSTPLGGYKNNYINNTLVVPTLYHGLKLFSGYRIGRGDFEIWDQYYLTNSGGEYRAGLDIPVFRNNEIDAQRAQLMSTHERICIAMMQKENIRIQSYQKAIVLYWAWVNAGLKLKVYSDLLSVAKIRQAAVEKRAKEGDVAEINITENKQFIVEREQLLNQARLVLKQSAINLSLFYRDQCANPLIPKQSRLPKTKSLTRSIENTKSRPPDKARLLFHPALLQLEGIQKINRIYLKLAHNALMPLMNVKAYTSKDNGRGDPRKNPTAARISVHFKFPVYLREARGEIIKVSADIRRLEQQRKLVMNKLVQSLENLIVSSQFLKKQFYLANKQVGMAVKIQKAEEKRFNAGGSSLFLVNQWEQNAIQARLRLIDEMTGYLQQTALIRYFISVQNQKCQTK